MLMKKEGKICEWFNYHAVAKWCVLNHDHTWISENTKGGWETYFLKSINEEDRYANASFAERFSDKIVFFNYHPYYNHK